jgi:uncharacterized protein YfaP (DUF2135 family)
MVVVAVLSLLSVDLSRAAPSFAKEFDVVGTVDCGQRSGQRCSLGDTLVLWTDSVTGELARITFDLSWVKKEMPSLDQDDEITVAVESLPDGKLRILSITSDEKRSGTKNPGQLDANGRSTATSARARLQDDDSTGARQIGIGTISGTVVSFQTLRPIQGAIVRVGSLTTTTNSTGTYVLSDIDAGTYTVEASASGFEAQTQQVTVTDAAGANASFQLLQTLPNIVMTLSWGPSPTDLDAHLSGPASGGGRFHLFFVSPNPETYASLTSDTQSGFGPEQVVVRRDPATNNYVAGEYRFWAHNFSGTPNFGQSQGRVVVTKDSQLLGTFLVGNASGDASEELWHVVNLQVTAAGDVTLTPVQQFTNGDGLTILRPPYGPKER